MFLFLAAVNPYRFLVSAPGIACVRHRISGVREALMAVNGVLLQQVRQRHVDPSRGDDPGAPYPRNAVVLAARVLLHPVHFPPARRAPDVRLRIRIAIKELHHV